MKEQKVFIEFLTSASLVIGAIVLASIAFRYPGVINLELGLDGGRVNITGTPSEQTQDKLLPTPDINKIPPSLDRFGVPIAFHVLFPGGVFVIVRVVVSQFNFDTPTRT